MSERTLRIVKAPCTCAKCAPTDRNAAARLASLTRLVALAKAERSVAKVVGTVADYAKAIATRISQGKVTPPPSWDTPPPPPDLNEAIRRAAKEKK